MSGFHHMFVDLSYLSMGLYLLGIDHLHQFHLYKMFDSDEELLFNYKNRFSGSLFVLSVLFVVELIITANFVFVN